MVSDISLTTASLSERLSHSARKTFPASHTFEDLQGPFIQICVAKYLAKGQPMRLNNLNSVNLKKLAAIVGLQLEHGGRELQLNLVKSLISSTSMDVSRDVFGYSNFQKRS
jgi:hypothetical protein